jgi:acetoin utilization protein AcuB
VILNESGKLAQEITMFVSDRMSAPAITARPDTPFQEALRHMREGRFRRLPVVNAAGRLVGIVSERDMLHASPSPATSLSIWEINYLLWELRVEQIMTTRVITVTPDLPIEEAARLMVVNRIGGLPVVDDQGVVVGVITETDIFRAFVELLGAHQAGIRAVVEVDAGAAMAPVHALAATEAEVISLTTYVDKQGPASPRRMLLKITGLDKRAALAALSTAATKVLDIRELERESS